MNHPNWVEDIRKSHKHDKDIKKLINFVDDAFKLANDYIEASGGFDETPTEFLNKWQDK